jgi:hypothetical protein
MLAKGKGMPTAGLVILALILATFVPGLLSWARQGEARHNNDASPPPAATAYEAGDAGPAAVAPRQGPGVLTDTTVADFGGGTLEANTHIASSDDGEVILLPAAVTEFDALDPGWFCATWSGTCAGAVSGGVATLNSIRIGTGTTGAADDTTGLFGPGRALEFAATFSGAPNQHVGFGKTFNETGWAIFSTGAGGSLFARTHTGSVALDTDLGASFLGGSHLFRIEWDASSVIYRIDGAEVAAHAIAPAADLRPLASDFVLDDGTPLVVDWIRMSPYPADGSFLSRVLDSGSAGADWQTLVTDADLAGGAIAVETRTGPVTDTGDASWSVFEPLVGTLITSPNNRYLQYRAALSTPDPSMTPALRGVTVEFDPCGPEVCNGLDDDCDGMVDEDGDALCDDGDACTGVETCGGASGCVAGTPVTCPDDGNVCTTEACDPATGVCATSDNTGPCDDGDPCTAGDACDGGVCQSGAALDCSALDSACTAGVCDAGSGTCVAQPINEGVACDDGNACTGPDRCVDGTCTGDPIVCDDGDVCTEDACDPATGCVATPAAAIEEFTGTSVPTGWGTLVWSTGGGVSVGGGVATIDGALLRTDAYFGPGTAVQFVATFDAAPFQHAGFGAGGDTAPQTFNSTPWAIFSTGSSGAGLQARTAVGSTLTDQPITGDFLGSSHTYRIEWHAASVDFYIDGSLVASHAVTITDPMRVAASDFEAGGAVLVLDSAGTPPACDDGDACTVGDVCSGTTCVGGAPLDCDDGSVCTEDTCDSAVGCVNTGTVVCDDGNACTTDTCNPATGDCETADNSDSCDDGNPCTVDDTCGGGACAGTPLVCPDDGNACTSEVCNPSTGSCDPVNKASTAESFSGSALPAGWGSFLWSDSGSVVVSGGTVQIDGAVARTDAFFGPGVSIEFVATFRTLDFDHIGFGGGGDTPPQTFNTSPWAIFSTGSTGLVLQARTWDGTATPVDETIPGDWLDAPHTFRIDWTPSGVSYFIEGRLVAVHATAIGAGMRIAASNFLTDEQTLVLDSIVIAPACEDGDACTAGDLCDAGSCVAGPAVTSAEAARALTFSDQATLAWETSSIYGSFNLYRGTVDGGTFDYDHTCSQDGLGAPTAVDTDLPLATEGFYYLVSGLNACGEGILGAASSGAARPHPMDCP